MRLRLWLLIIALTAAVCGWIGYTEGRVETSDMTTIAIEYQQIAIKLSGLLNECDGPVESAIPRQSHFSSLMPIVFKREGVDASNPTGYAWIPGDRGGETNWGISQSAWNVVRDGTFVKFPTSVKDLTKAQAKAIYRRVYYLPIFDKLPRSVALVAFDAEVNQNRAVAFLERSIGPLNDSTIARVYQDPKHAVDALLWARLTHYSALAQKSQVNRDFLARFWLPRLIALRKEARQFDP